MREYKLGEIERLLLLHQYQILASTTDGDEEYYKEKIEILESGYEHEYYELFEELYNPLSVQESEYVWDVLEMYSSIVYSYRLLENSAIDGEEVKFRGFDGNEEAKLRSYCIFIIKTMNRYGELYDPRECDDYNTHHPTDWIYKPMLEKWNSMGKPIEMSESSLSELLNSYKTKA